VVSLSVEKRHLTSGYDSSNRQAAGHRVDGPLAEIEVRAREADAVMFQASIGRVMNLAWRQADAEEAWYGLDIIQGG
jgi:hypothetical protein